MADVIEKFHGATIQHGPENARIYLMKVADTDPAELVPQLDRLARQLNYTKIFAKVPESSAKYFLDMGYQCEATVPEFFNGKETACFLSYYLTEERLMEPNAQELDHLTQLALSKSKAPSADKDTGFTLHCCQPQEAQAMSAVYKRVFPSYPFPIDDPNYIRQTMDSHIAYYGASQEGKLVALSSAEMDETCSNVEMTDFATLPEWRGHGLAAQLLARMEIEMQNRGIHTAYTIARAVSPGMNITFAKKGYHFSGRLINNTNISGNIESMNVWYKSLASLF